MPPRRRCDACRTSQRPCDQKRPKCSRCITKSTSCTYASATTLQFVDQNGFSAELSRRAAGRRQIAQRQTAVINLDVSPLTSPEGERIPSPLAWNLENRVLERFFARWAVGGTCLGSQRFVLGLYESSGHDGVLRAAVMATAYADLAVAERHGDFADKSILAYQTSLRRLQGCLDETGVGERATSQGVFVAILGLDSLEILYIRRPTPLGVHTRAIVHLLRLKTQSAVGQDAQTIALIRATAPRLQARYLLSNDPSLGKAVRSLAQWAEHDLDVRVAEFITNACDILQALEEKSRTLSERRQLIKVLQSFLDEMEDWLDTHAQETSPKPVPLTITSPTTWPLPRLKPEVLITAQTWAARDWVLFHMCRIKILDVLIPNNTFSPKDIKASTDFLLNLVPFLIGLVDRKGHARTELNDTGLLIAQYPLWMIGMSRYVAEEAREEAGLWMGFVEGWRALGGKTS